MRFILNGAEAAVDAHPLARLLDVLRERVGLTGPKLGCGEGQCGSCTVLVDGRAVAACTTPVTVAARAAVTTVEGLVVDGRLQAMLDDDQLGPGESDRSREGRLDVVRLHPRVGEPDHLDVSTADSLRDPGQRVEACGHPYLAVVARDRGASPEGRCEEKCDDPAHENHSHP